MTTPPGTCHCGYLMEFRADPTRLFRWDEDAHDYVPDLSGIYWCPHCDLGCVGASNGCHQCKKMGVKL